jgi:hypothetical protein
MVSKCYEESKMVEQWPSDGRYTQLREGKGYGGKFIPRFDEGDQYVEYEHLRAGLRVCGLSYSCDGIFFMGAWYRKFYLRFGSYFVVILAFVGEILGKHNKQNGVND